jgi:hypothetical protein
MYLIVDSDREAPRADPECQEGNLLMMNVDDDQQLQATYASALMAASGYKVFQPGCTFVVQKAGIAACPSTKTVVRSVYEEG